MGLFDGLFGGDAPGLNFGDVGKAASPYYDKIAPELKNYYSPYINMGKQTMPALQEALQKLLSSPGGMLNNIGSSFQQSPGFDFQRKMGMNAVNQAAAAGGMTGTPQHQMQSAEMVNGLANQDYYNWLNNALGMYNQGLQGMGHMNDIGYNASSSLAENLASALMSQGNLAYSGALNQQQSGNAFMGDLFGMAANVLPFFL